MRPIRGAEAGSVGQAIAELRAQPAASVVLDLSGVGFLDSVGLEVLIRVHRVLRAEGRRLVLRDPAPPVARLLELTLLDRTLSIEGVPAGWRDVGPPFH